MSVSFYDEAIVYKLKKWMPEQTNLRIYSPNETKKLFSIMADDTNDQPIKLPFISLARNNEIELTLNIKNLRSFDSYIVNSDNRNRTVTQWNVIPIKLVYQMDIFTKTVEDGEEYLRNFLFKIINNPSMSITIPYNNMMINHVVNIRVLSNVADTSDISERLFSGQFHRWTIQFELQDAFLFNLPTKKGWMIDGVILETYKDETYNPKDKEVEWELNLEDFEKSV